jgi:colicin import membrane protein
VARQEAVQVPEAGQDWEALAELAEQERQAEQGVPAREAPVPEALAEQAPGLAAPPGARWEALKRGAQALAQEQAAQERARLEAAGLAPAQAPQVAALGEALNQAAAEWWRQAGAPLAAALEQAGRQLAEALRPLAALAQAEVLAQARGARAALAHPVAAARWAQVARALRQAAESRPPAGE